MQEFTNFYSLSLKRNALFIILAGLSAWSSSNIVGYSTVSQVSTEMGDRRGL